jgi:type I restriction enzyme, S subunit
VWLVSKSNTRYRKIASTEFLPIFSKVRQDGTVWLIPEIIWANLLSPNLYEAIKLKVKGSTGSRQRIKPHQLLEEFVPVPPLAAQNKLAKKLQLTYLQSNNLERNLQKNSDKIKLLGAAFLDEVFQKFRNKCELKDLSKIVKPIGGATPSKANSKYWGGDIPWVSPKDMKIFEITDSEDHITKEAVEKSKVNIIPQNSIIVVFRSGILAHSFPVSINRVVITTNQDIKSLIPIGDVIPEFLAYFLKSQEKTILNKCSKFGATVHSIDSDRFFSFQIPIPKMEEQRSCISKIEKFKKLHKELSDIHRVMQNTMKSLVPSIIQKLLNG